MNKAILFILISVFSLTGQEKTKTIPSLQTLAILSLEKNENLTLAAMKPERTSVELAEQIVHGLLQLGRTMSQREMIQFRGKLISMIRNRQETAITDLFRKILESDWSDEQKKIVAEGLLASYQQAIQDVYEIVLTSENFTASDKKVLIKAFYEAFNIAEHDKDNLDFLYRFFDHIQPTDIVTPSSMLGPTAFGCFEPTKIMSLLLDFGADPKQANPYGETILLEAVRRGIALPVLILLKYCPELANVCTSYNLTPLHLAARPNGYYKTEDRLKIINALIDAGADKNARHNGQTPLQIYTEDECYRSIQDPEVIRLLTMEP